MNIIDILFAFLISILLSITVAPATKLLAKKVDAIDRPSKRKTIHTDEVPRLGGIAIFCGSTLSVLLFLNNDSQTIYILLGALIIAAAGIADDIIDLNYLVKLIIQLSSALLVISSGVKINELYLIGGSIIKTGPFSIPLTLIWIVGITNAFNMIDGLDGLSCGISALSSLTLSCISFLCGNIYSTTAYIAISGACFGFLPYNIYPARIFMGDTGSILLGFLISSFSVRFLFSESKLSVLSIILALAFPLTELIFTFFRRILKRKNPLKADNGHIHHILISKNLSHIKAVCLLFVISGISSIVSILMFLLLN